MYEIGKFVEFVEAVKDRGVRFPESPGSKWYCAVTNPNCQARAVLGLYEAGFRSFYPKVRRWISHARVRKAVERPLLGRYVFVEVDYPRQSFGAVRAVNGVESIVSNPDPLPLPSSWVPYMRERYMDGEWDFVRTDTPCPWYDECGDLKWRTNPAMPIGARIKIMEGEFMDMLATVTGRNRNGKLEFKVMDSTSTSVIRERMVRAA